MRTYTGTVCTMYSKSTPGRSYSEYSEYLEVAAMLIEALRVFYDTAHNLQVQYSEYQVLSTCKNRAIVPGTTCQQAVLCYASVVSYGGKWCSRDANF